MAESHLAFVNYYHMETVFSLLPSCHRANLSDLFAFTRFASIALTNFYLPDLFLLTHPSFDCPDLSLSTQTGFY